MLVKNRYGGVQNMPDRVAVELIKAGTVTAVVAEVKPEVKIKPKKAKEPDATEAKEVE